MVGRPIVINARPHQIVGVMPAHFTFGGEYQVLLPLRINTARPLPFFRLNGVARMKPGVTLAQANTDIARMLRSTLRIPDEYQTRCAVGADIRTAQTGRSATSARRSGS